MLGSCWIRQRRILTKDNTGNALQTHEMERLELFLVIPIGTRLEPQTGVQKGGYLLEPVHRLVETSGFGE